MLPNIWVVFLKQLSDELDKFKLLILQDKDQGPQEGDDHSMGDYTSPVPPSHLKRNGEKKIKQVNILISRGKMSGARKQMPCSVSPLGEQLPGVPRWTGRSWRLREARSHSPNPTSTCDLEVPACLPLRSSGTGCWTGCTSQLSPGRLYSYPQTLCTPQAGWPAGRDREWRERSVSTGRGED